MAATVLKVVDLTEWVEEGVEAAINFLGQLSGRLIAVEGERDEEEYALALADQHHRPFCGQLWAIEDLTEVDARWAGLRLLPGIPSPGWRVWLGERDYLIWRDARCGRRSVKLRCGGAEWWRAQLAVHQPRDPYGLEFSDCTRDPAEVPHDARIWF